MFMSKLVAGDASNSSESTNPPMGRGILFSEMTPPSGRESEFNAWYDEEHIPLRMGVAGFYGAQRYRETTPGQGAPGGYLAVYDTADADVFRSAAYGEVKGRPSALTKDMLSSVSGFTRYLANELDRVAQPGLAHPEQVPVLYAVWFEVPTERLADFDDWYARDHIPLLMQSTDWGMVRRFHVVDGDPPQGNRLALHYLKDVAALDSDARAKARATPWRTRISAEPWFKARYQVFTAQGPRFHPAIAR